jgi:hypothetical protein
MPWETISDLYNSSLQNDNIFANQILAFVHNEIQARTDTNQDFSFSLDIFTFPFVDSNNDPITLGLAQLIRINDIVQFNLRNVGIRCSAYIPQISYPNVIPNITSLVLNISWFIRKDREFMKQYY